MRHLKGNKEITDVSFYKAFYCRGSGNRRCWQRVNPSPSIKKTQYNWTAFLFLPFILWPSNYVVFSYGRRGKRNRVRGKRNREEPQIGTENRTDLSPSLPLESVRFQYIFGVFSPSSPLAPCPCPHHSSSSNTLSISLRHRDNTIVKLIVNLIEELMRQVKTRGLQRLTLSSSKKNTNVISPDKRKRYNGWSICISFLWWQCHA